MDFEFTDDQMSLRDAVARWVEKGFSFERRHKLAKEGGATRAVYGELAELGLAGLAVPEAHGGMGFGAVEAMVVCEELGRGLVNAPYAHAALVAPALLAAASADVQAAWLPRIASGDALVVLAHQEAGARYRLNQVSARAEQGIGGWRITGKKIVVPAGDEADAFIVPARISGGERDSAGIGLFLVEASATQVRGLSKHSAWAPAACPADSDPGCRRPMPTHEPTQAPTQDAELAGSCGAYRRLPAPAARKNRLQPQLHSKPAVHAHRSQGSRPRGRRRRRGFRRVRCCVCCCVRCRVRCRVRRRVRRHVRRRAAAAGKAAPG